MIWDLAANLFTRLGLILFSVVAADVEDDDATLLVALLVLLEDDRFSKFSDISEINIFVKAKVVDSLDVVVVMEVVFIVDVDKEVEDDTVVVSAVLSLVKVLLIPFDMETDFLGIGCGFFGGKSNVQNYQKIK